MKNEVIICTTVTMEMFSTVTERILYNKKRSDCLRNIFFCVMAKFRGGSVCAIRFETVKQDRSMELNRSTNKCFECPSSIEAVDQSRPSISAHWLGSTQRSGPTVYKGLHKKHGNRSRQSRFAKASLVRDRIDRGTRSWCASCVRATSMLQPRSTNPKRRIQRYFQQPAIIPGHLHANRPALTPESRLAVVSARLIQLFFPSWREKNPCTTDRITKNTGTERN